MLLINQIDYIVKNTSNLQDLITRLNNFPTHYEMNSMQSKWDAGNDERWSLDKAFSKLSKDELIQIKSETTLSPEMIDRYYAEFFSDLPEPKTEAKASVNRSEIFKAAWYYFKIKGIYETFSNALKAAWAKAKIMIALRAGNVTLKFRKSSGEIRTAIATLKLDTPYTPKTKSIQNPDVIKFFEIDNGWRSCRIERVLSAA